MYSETKDLAITYVCNKYKNQTLRLSQKVFAYNFLQFLVSLTPCWVPFDVEDMTLVRGGAMIFMNEVNHRWYEREKGGLVGQAYELIIRCVWRIWQWCGEGGVMVFMNEVNCKWYEREKGGLVGQAHGLIIGCEWMKRGYIVCPHVRDMANAVPHTLFQWSLSCLQFILLFLSLMGTLLSYYTLVFCFTLLLSPCIGTIQFLHKRVYIHCPYSVSGLSWYQHQSLAPFWLSSHLLVLWSMVLSPILSTVPMTVWYHLKYPSVFFPCLMKILPSRDLILLCFS